GRKAARHVALAKRLQLVGAALPQSPVIQPHGWARSWGRGSRGRALDCAPMDASAAAERIWPGRQAIVTPLSGGITNHNFKVDVDGEAFVLRMAGAQTAVLGIDRRVEWEASRRAAAVGVGPEVADFIEPEGWLVTRF